MNENFCKSISDAVASKKVVIYGAGYIGAMMLNIMDILGKEVLFFLDQSPAKQNSGFCGYKVKAPEDILYEDISQIIVVIAGSDMGKVEMENMLIGFGLKKDEEFIVGANMRTDPFDSLDPFLGYSRSVDKNGFKVMGSYNEKYKSIICLGGSTTDYAMFGIKSWPEFLFELFQDNNVHLNILNGGVGGYTSSQELLKLIRDGLELSPSLVISYSGINDFMEKTPVLGHKYLYEIWDMMKPVVTESGIKARGMHHETLTVSYGTKSNLNVAEYWYRNEIMMCNICRGLNIPFLGILQPTILSKGIDTRSLFEQRMRQTFATNGYTTEQIKKARQLVNEGCERNIVDFTSLFDQYENVFADACHVFEQGNKIIAEAIFQTIKEKHLLDI